MANLVENVSCIDEDPREECHPSAFLNSTEYESETDDEDGSQFIPPWPLQVAYILAFVSMVVVAAGGNLIVIWIVLAHKRMRTVTNYFLVNLAVADALISIFNTLFSFAYLLYNDWVFGKAYCKFTQFIATCTISASVFTFMAIAIDRYSAIMHPLKPRMGAFLVVGVIGGIWLAAVAIALPNVVYAETYTYPSNRVVCYLEWPDGVHKTIDFAYNICLIVVNYLAPLSALAVTYTLVGRQLWGSQAIGERTAGQEETIRSKRRVVKMLIVVVVIFAVCWLPQHVYFIVTNFYSPETIPHVQHIYLVIYWVAMSNSMYNPIMYCWMNARFRNGFKFVFRWLPCINWQPNDTLGIGGAKLVRMSASDGGTVYRLGATERNGTTSRQTTVISCLSDSPEHENSAYLKSCSTAKTGQHHQKQQQQQHQTTNFRAMTLTKEDAF